MADEMSSSSFLTIPTRITRTGSHESFATDLSLLSLSSFTSDMCTKHRVSIDTEDFESECSEMIAYREHMLEKMLENHVTFSLKKLGGKRSKSAEKKDKTEKEKKPKERTKKGGYTQLGDENLPQVTESDDELLEECARTPQENRPRTILYKSFSTSDLEALHDALHPMGLLKPCASQAWIPTFFVQTLQSRRKHIQDMKNTDSRELLKDLTKPPDKIFQFGEEERLSTPRKVVIASASPKVMIRHFDSKDSSEASPTGEASRRANSLENIPLLGAKKSPGPIMRKLRYSKEIGKRIRDDLLKKLGKQKQKIITKMDLEREKGRPVSKNERNFMIFHWLQSLNDDAFDDS